MKPIIFSLILICMGFAAVYFGRDPAVWFASSLVVNALARKDEQ
jgi:hypothetical protein